VIVLRQLAHRPDVHLLSPLRQAPELETLDHSLTKFGHGYTSYVLSLRDWKYRGITPLGEWSASLRGWLCPSARSA
jgi:hypothetical protein